MRRTAGVVLFALGLALLAFVGTTYAQGALARERARSAWSAEQARQSVSRAWLAADGYLVSPAAPGAPVARLWIPSIGLDEIVVSGVEKRDLLAGPGHLPGSVLPGQRGNAIISAHRDRHFSSLDRVSVGDTVVTEAERRRVRWVVVSKRVLGSEEPALFDSDEPRLTLTTCWPVRYLGSAPDRLLLSAVPIEVSRGA